VTTLANLIARKQQLMDRMHEGLGPNEREEIERLLQQIDIALDLLGDAGSSKPSDE
jgi:hypothetical protein